MPAKRSKTAANRTAQPPTPRLRRPRPLTPGFGAQGRLRQLRRPGLEPGREACATRLARRRRCFCSATRGRLMRWTPGDRSNIDDARGRSAGGIASLGIGGFLILLVLSWVSGTNLFTLLGTDSSSPAGSGGTSGELRTSPTEARTAAFAHPTPRDPRKTSERIPPRRYHRT